jgi:3-hydroxybutyryl-CoA dehydrogenase
VGKTPHQTKNTNNNKQSKLKTEQEMLSRLPNRVLSLASRSSVALGRRGAATTRKVQQLAVVGAGQMGGGIAQVAAQVGKLPVILVDKNQTQLDKTMKFMGTLKHRERKEKRKKEKSFSSLVLLASCDL